MPPIYIYYGDDPGYTVDCEPGKTVNLGACVEVTETEAGMIRAYQELDYRFQEFIRELDQRSKIPPPGAVSRG